MDRRLFLTALFGAPALATAMLTGVAEAAPLAVPAGTVSSALATGTASAGDPVIEPASWVSQGVNRTRRQVFGHRRRRYWNRRRYIRRRR